MKISICETRVPSYSFISESIIDGFRRIRASLNSNVIIKVYAQEGSERKPQGKQLGKESVRIEMIMPSLPGTMIDLT